jgi:hypothetical protein
MNSNASGKNVGALQIGKSSGTVRDEASIRDPCKRFACSLQDCLQKFNYNENKCADVIDKLRLCCLDNYGAGSISKHNNVISPTCSGFVN